MSLDLAEPVRSALVVNAPITSLLAPYKGSFSVFTKKPVGKDAPYPLIVCGPATNISDIDGLVSRRPVLTYPIVAYGRKNEHYRDVESLGFLIRNLFHRERFSISVAAANVVEIVCSGPRVAPVDDDSLIGRLNILTVTLREQE